MTGSPRKAVILRNGVRFAEVIYSGNRLVDGIACVLAVMSFCLPFVMIVALFGRLPLCIQVLLNPLDPASGPLWQWCAVITSLAGCAYLLSLLVLHYCRSRVRIRTTGVSARYPCGVEIKEKWTLSPRKVKADVVINGRHEGVVRALERRLLSYRCDNGSEITFVSVMNGQRRRETVVSVLFVLIGSLFSSLVVPSRRRLQQQWTVEDAGHSLGELEYRRSMSVPYQMQLDVKAEERSLEILAVALLLARPASSGSVESYEELH